MCSGGLACRGHQCIAETCAASNECSAEAPYCSTSSGLCAGTCEHDSECPGASESASDSLCVGGACVACRADVAADCRGNAPVCDSGACRGCKEHDECASGACGTDGSCIDPSQIEYVSKTGSSTGNCTNVNPCNSIEHALALNRTYIVIEAGTYQGTTNYTLIASRWFIGRGAPIITTTAKGAIFTVGAIIDAHFAHLQISGASDTGTNTFDGTAIYCSNASASGTIDLDDVSVYSNSGSGIESRVCAMTVRRSRFRSNLNDGLFVQANLNVDRTEFSGNGFDGLDFDGFSAHVSNVYAFHNSRNGIEYNSDSAGNSISFSTTVDNGHYGIAGYQQATSGHTVAITNDVVARNALGGIDCSGTTGCIYDGTISMTGSDVSPLHFKSPDTQPYDYHLLAGSSAIDAAATSTLDHDYDGDPRPRGAGRDVGADEAQ